MDICTKRKINLWLKDEIRDEWEHTVEMKNNNVPYIKIMIETEAEIDEWDETLEIMKEP